MVFIPPTRRSKEHNVSGMFVAAALSVTAVVSADFSMAFEFWNVCSFAKTLFDDTKIVDLVTLTM